MKRSPPQRRTSVRTSDPFKNLSTEQLSYIGAIALLYNDVEASIDWIFSLVIRAPVRAEELTSRINGIDGKLALIKLGVRSWGFDEAEAAHLADVLGKSGFELLKSWRDAVIHAQVLDAVTSTGKVIERRGRVSEVLLSLEALKGLFNRLEFMRIELAALRGVLARKQQLVDEELKEFQFELDDQDREQLEQGILDDWLQAQEHRTRRLSLPPIPEFPEDISAAEAFLRAYQGISENLAKFPGLSSAK